MSERENYKVLINEIFERYDLIIPEKFFNSPLMEPLLSLFEDVEFREMVSALPGYDIAPMGKIISELPKKQA